MTDEPGWITKADAATLLGVDARTIERRARAGKLNAKARPGFPTLYWAADVEKLAQTSPQEVRTGILTAVPPSPSNGNGAVAHQRSRTATFEEVFVEVLHALRGALAPGPTGPTVTPTGPTAETLVLTLEEAAAVSGWSVGFLRRARASGRLPADRDRWRGADGRWHVGWKIRRKDLEAL
jgi:hypothetical protein